MPVECSTNELDVNRVVRVIGIVRLHDRRCSEVSIEIQGEDGEIVPCLAYVEDIASHDLKLDEEANRFVRIGTRINHLGEASLVYLSVRFAGMWVTDLKPLQITSG